MYICWLVVTGAWLDYDFPFSWEESSQLTFIFFGGVETRSCDVFNPLINLEKIYHHEIVHRISWELNGSLWPGSY